MKMSSACEFSFDTLYQAAFGKKITREEKRKLQKMPQEKINNIVSIWSSKAGWKTERIRGQDGIEYLAFYFIQIIANQQV